MIHFKRHKSHFWLNPNTIQYYKERETKNTKRQRKRRRKKAKKKKIPKPSSRPNLLSIPIHNTHTHTHTHSLSLYTLYIIAFLSERERVIVPESLNYESASSANRSGAAAVCRRRRRSPGSMRRLQTDLDGGAWRDGVRVSDLSIASDASSGAHESPIQDRRRNDDAASTAAAFSSSSCGSSLLLSVSASASDSPRASFLAAAATRAGARYRSDEDPGAVRSLQGHSQCPSWLGQVHLPSVQR